MDPFGLKRYTIDPNTGIIQDKTVFSFDEFNICQFCLMKNPNELSVWPCFASIEPRPILDVLSSRIMRLVFPALLLSKTLGPLMRITSLNWCSVIKSGWNQ